jgi:hypothetical protein
MTRGAVLVIERFAPFDLRLILRRSEGAKTNQHNSGETDNPIHTDIFLHVTAGMTSH